MQRGVENVPVTDRPLPDCNIRVREVIPWRAIPQMPPPRGVDLPPRCPQKPLSRLYSSLCIHFPALPCRFDRLSMDHSLHCQRCPSLGEGNDSLFGHALYMVSIVLHLARGRDGGSRETAVTAEVV